MGRAAAKLSFWLIFVWAVSLAGRDPRSGSTVSVYHFLTVPILTVVAVRVSRHFEYPLLFFLFGCAGMFPLSTSLLFDWEHSFDFGETPLQAIICRACVPIVGMGLICRTLSVHWPDFDEPVNDGLCKKCGYNLTGNISGICPECGTVIPRGEIQRDRGSPNR
ncbi:MAG TPA: hypothetical protein VMV81_06265 [Phycisphaerae bacterium]|nr:hypothetical protein [Phycisphaerae bacterium]